MDHPPVLLVHGVSSTGQWHETTTMECHGVFECISIKYRYYHGWTGAIKVYAWPTAVIWIAAVATLLAFDSQVAAANVLLAILTLNTLLVIHAEFDWSHWTRLLFFPVSYAVLGAAAVLLLPAHASCAFLVASIIGGSVFLEVREYVSAGSSAWWACVVSILVFGATLICARWLLEHEHATYLWWTIVIFACLALLEPFIRRECAFRYMDLQCRRHCVDRQRPHVVAHSLGTYMIGHLMQENSKLTFGRIIFTGCVLDQSFPWQLIIGPSARGACFSVKNCVGTGDFVPVITGVLRSVWLTLTGPFRVRRLDWLRNLLARTFHWRPLGWAGQRGFYDSDPVVHSLTYDIACTKCLGFAGRASVHNVPFFAGHSTLNADPEHQCFQWLPFLWGSNAAEFDLWVGICRGGYKALAAVDELNASDVTPNLLLRQSELADAELLLLKGPWYWPLHPDGPTVTVNVPGRGLREYVKEVVVKHQASFSGSGLDVDRIMTRIPGFIFRKVALALAERKRTNPIPEVTALLEPRVAFLSALCDAINVDR